jgi:multiple antibiotic resistance protein
VHLPLTLSTCTIQRKQRCRFIETGEPLSEIARDFYLTFVPLFIVIDAFGNLPFVISLSSELTSPEKRRLVHLAILTATALGLIFLFFGQFILNLMVR